MPDNQRTMRYSFQTEFDPRGVEAATKGVGGVSAAFTQLGSQIERTNFGRALETMQQFKGVLPGMASAGSNAAKGVISMTSAASDLNNEVLSAQTGMRLLKQQFKGGLIDKGSFKEGMNSYRAIRQELKGMTAEQYQGRVAYREAMEEATKLSAASQGELQKLGIPMRHFRSAIVGSTVDVQKLHDNIRKWGRDPAPQEVQRYAELYNSTLRQQSLLQDEAQASRDRLNKSMTFKGAAGAAMGNLKTLIVSPFKKAYGWATKIPVRITEGVKDGMSNMFGVGGFVSKVAGGLMKRVFSKKTIARTLALGPLGFLSGVLSKPKSKDDRGFVSGGGGPMGGLLKSLGSFSGMLKYAMGALSPMFLLMKVLTPVLQTLQWVLEPLMAPLQQLLSDAVLGLVPFFSEIAGLFSEMANELMPPLMKMVKSLGPVFVELARTILPPLVKILKTTITWITNVVTVIMKALIPVLGWVADKFVWLADNIAGALNWLGSMLLNLPVIGWALKKLGISSDAFTPSKEATEGPGGAGPGQAPAALPGVNVQGAGVAGAARAMTIQEAGGLKAFSEFTQPRGHADPIPYSSEGQMGDAAARNNEAMRAALGDRPSIVDKQDPKEMSEPVVATLKRMTEILVEVLPKRIGQETKSVSLVDFSAVTA